MKNKKLLTILGVTTLLVGGMFVNQEKRLVSAATEKTIYIDPAEKSSDGAWFQAWTWGGTQADSWVTFGDSDGDGILEGNIFSDRTGMKVLRKGPTQAANSWTSWNVTGDITIPTNGNNKWTWSGGWNNVSGSWSSYTPPVGYTAHVLTLVGSFQGWSPTDADYLMTDPTEKHIYEIELELEPGDYQFKIAKDKAWDTTYGDGSFTSLSSNVSGAGVSGNLSLTAEGGKYKFVFDFTNKTLNVTHTSYETLNTSLTSLISKYYNNGTYNRHTIINLNEAAQNELISCFHAKVNKLERNTYFTKNALWMENEEGTYSYYGTSGNDLTGGRVSEIGKTVDTIALKDVGGMEEYYTTLKDIMGSTNVKWTNNNGVWTCSEESVIEQFLAFTAPCFLGLNESNANYFSLTGVSIQEVGESLVLKLLTNGDSGKFVEGANNVLSVATITK